MNKYIILEVILGKANILPEKYNIKKEFTQLTCKKKRCCFKKLINDELF